MRKRPKINKPPLTRFRLGGKIYRVTGIEKIKKEQFVTVKLELVCMENPPDEYLKEHKEFRMKYPIKSTIYSEFVLLK